MKAKILVFLATLTPFLVFSQQTSNVRGMVVDAQTELYLPGAIVQLITSDTVFTTATDANGEFYFNNVPTGRFSLKAQYVGYLSTQIDNLLLIKGKEFCQKIKLEQSVVELGNIIVTSTKNKLTAQNEMTTVSSRSFTIEETERFAGSRGDPSRMAANYAGVIINTDQRNDIVIRGNNPVGLLWRLEGIDIPNPNHYGAVGVTGGVISMLNNNTLANSDFLTGAFPAEYGNALSGVFDLQMRSGNNKRYEFLGQVGFNGFEFGAEGPISKQNGSSFIINGRYSTLEAMSYLGFDYGTGAAIPRYKDLSFKIHFPRTKFGNICLFGLGGINSIAMLDSKGDSASYQFGGTDLYYNNYMYTVGFNNKIYFSNNTRLNLKAAIASVGNGTIFDSLMHKGIDTIYNFYKANGNYDYLTIGSEFFSRFTNKDILKIGFNYRHYRLYYADSVTLLILNKKISQINIDTNYNYFQAYSSYQHKFSNNLIFNLGVFFHYLALNKTYNIEPRFGLKWIINSHHNLNLGATLHSQTQIPLFYFIFDSLHRYSNVNLDMTKAAHFVVGYDIFFTKTMRFKAETYYQYIYNVPISKNNPKFSFINEGADFYIISDTSMVNKGKGRNYGIELTFEKFLSEGFYFLVTSSFFKALYTTGDGKELESRFSNNYVINILAGYEHKISQTATIAFDIKSTYAGGQRYIPVNEILSKEKNELVLDWDHAFEKKHPDYFRLNARITFRLAGKKKISQEWGLDLENITNHKNIYTLRWNGYKKELETVYQLGFMPMMTYKIYF